MPVDPMSQPVSACFHPAKCLSLDDNLHGYPYKELVFFILGNPSASQIPYKAEAQTPEYVMKPLTLVKTPPSTPTIC